MGNKNSQHDQQQQQQQIEMFWASERAEAENTNDLKSHQQLPVGSIRKIMKAGEDVDKISAETPIILAKACELFIREITIRSWLRIEKKKRRTIKGEDITRIVNNRYNLAFLRDVQHDISYFKSLMR